MKSEADFAIPREGRYATVNGIRMYYELHGEGEPLVLLHSFNASGTIWHPFLPDFARRYRLIVPDLRGHGRTEDPSRLFSHRQAALDIRELLDLLGVARFRAIGISSGAMILLYMAHHPSRRPEAMVLVGSTFYYPDSARSLMKSRTMATLTPELMEKLRRHHRLGDDQIRALHAFFHRLHDDHEDMNLTAGDLAAIETPTLIVHGDGDTYFPPSIAMEMHRAIPNAYLWIVPNGRHFPIFDRPEEFTRTALEFLGGDWEAGASRGDA